MEKMRELNMEELENINGGINWWEVVGGAGAVAGGIAADATGIGAIAGALSASAGVESIYNGLTGKTL